MQEKMGSFQNNELNRQGVYPNLETWYGYPWRVVNKLTTPITPKENMRNFLERKELCWIPDFGCDFNMLYPDFLPDNFAGKFEGGIDSFGVTWVPVEHADLPSIVMPGNPKLEDICDWRELQFPDVDAWEWEENGRKYLEALDPDRMYLGIMLSGWFERMISLMDFMNAAMSLISDPEEVSAFLDRLTDYNIALAEHFHTYFHTDVLLIHDDWGAQKAPFFSEEVARTVFLPHMKRFARRVHELGMFVIMHSCGCTASRLPVMIEAGMDGWQLQPDANPGIDEIIENYGPQILFVYNDLIPDNLDDDEAKAYIRERMDKCCSKGYCMFGANSIVERNFDIREYIYEYGRTICDRTAQR